jgi:2-polyprenyl-3-methyl-5-hydroxy-6-metoxy-1,4-benzoquinol methylase
VPDITQRIQFRAVSTLIRDISEEKVLDMGCGHGLFSTWMAKRGNTQICFDVDPSNVKFTNLALRGLGLSKRSECIVASISSLPFKDNSFGIALCMEVLEHVPDDEEAILEIQRILAPKGALILTTPSKVQEFPSKSDEKYAKLWGHVRRGYTPETLIEMLDNAGLEVIALKYWLKFFGVKMSDAYFALFWKRLSKFRLALSVLVFPAMFGIVLLDELFLRKRKGNEILIKAVKD